MKSLTVSVAGVSILAFSSPSWAADVQALLNSSDCYTCHAVDQKLVGPSFKMVADRYRGQTGAEDMLASKIISGGTGHWDKDTGGMAMPPHPGFTNAQAKEVANWILSLK